MITAKAAARLERLEQLAARLGGRASESIYPQSVMADFLAACGLRSDPEAVERAIGELAGGTPTPLQAAWLEQGYNPDAIIVSDDDFAL
jgi:hypothetical protein